MIDAKPTILVIDDADEDFDLLQHAFTRCAIDFPLLRCKSASETLELLRPGPPQTALPISCIFLDLNLPDMGGKELLEQLRALPNVQAIPILIWSTSKSPRDVHYCYARGANSYMVKPIGIKKLTQMAASFRDFWLSTAELPK